MGKYMKKESSNSSPLGVLTRARTLALQPNPELSYLQLRSRRLEKPPFPQHHQQQQQQCSNQNVVVVNNKVRANSADSVGGSVSISKGRFGHFSDSHEEFHDFGNLEGYFGENNLDFDARGRSTRESTPCSLIRDPETIGTPGSTTRPTCSTSSNRRARNTQRTIPTNPEMEEFFAGFEDNQQKFFVEKYNYDIMNDVPLPGRYEWVKVD